MKHNNQLPVAQLRKHQQFRIKTFFNQAAQKKARLHARRAQAAAVFPRPTEKLQPVVRKQTQRYNKSTKLGRGFTLQELKAAGISAAFAQSIGIKVDHRRKNRCQESLELNKKRLLAYVSKLVLFPRHQGKAKKGLVNDTADTSSAAQNALQTSVPLPSVSKREKAVSNIAELRKKKVYRIIRQEKTNQKWDGKRKAKAQAAAEPKA
ncbi:60S ribosomal protein L13 (macronuclear) [Tetrahymena thermophila SB210]|uniref:Large ribosomal subunit protein eL13 n=1 Tax=Tetrahymena thermophila (strain SB210) TaxID=312017 RepID=RL13_TETTS|nr:60S ribosomal protein L13 [Tetrahymena thermophila SB210]P0DJ58.1 RecName: Full=Large ribosomal subunit protein eL13; AltName: Full=60S ribosomal protein L13 [Tetrahymena thermophila SB210]4V8P_AU Chain AU, RPL13 [Tetrahymena thermophila]4V8P_DU Chain DU, RPL13 [Tetrahymena thermophila]4V8P_FU Chain FU, RPL13 [Tetrahymena thermophila]4V8P_HU Chain HU, RPL13 [Tetrahymena thermophila]EAS02620.1 60S ribosomal protein L13 [Tetrahymena thermophila SB210]|eukprot:XP_001022864.1 60S ribosomal protein L13 [Tetrahymena thermophila SB210]